MRLNPLVLTSMAVAVYAFLWLVWAGAELVCFAQTNEWLAIEGIHPCLP